MTNGPLAYLSCEQCIGMRKSVVLKQIWYGGVLDRHAITN